MTDKVEFDVKMQEVPSLKMTLEDVQRHFVSPLSPADSELYQARLGIAQGVQWKNGAYYAIGDAGEHPGGYDLYKCLEDAGMVYLGKEDACGDIEVFEPVYFVLYTGCSVIPQ